MLNRRTAVADIEDEVAPGGKDPASAPLWNDLDYLIRTLRRRQVAMIDQMLLELGLPLSAGYPLVVLSLGDGVSQRELGKRLHLKDAAMGKAVDGLIAEGLARRADDPLDRRKFLVMLTPKGRKVAAEVVAERAELLETMQKGFSGKERDLFKQFLQRAYTNLGEIGGLPEDEGTDNPPPLKRSSR